MKVDSRHCITAILAPLLLCGCAASQMHGFQNAYKGYNVPESLVEQIRSDLKKAGLLNAKVARDNVGRIRLIGSYKNEDEVDHTFIIVQNRIGIESTSPFYPENIEEKRWELAARRALAQKSKDMQGSSNRVGVKRALIVGISKFKDSERLKAIFGEEDARRVQEEAEKAGYKTITLLGPQATKSNIEDAIERTKRELGPNDSLLIYISSHGTEPVPKPGRSFQDARKMSIVAYDTGDTNMPTRTRIEQGEWKWKAHTSSVPDTLVQELAQRPTRQTRVIIDTCFSGDILKDIPDESQSHILKTNGGMPQRFGISMAAWTGDEYAAKGIVFSNEDGRSGSRSGNKSPQQVAATSQEIAGMNRYTIITATSHGEFSWGPAGGEFESPVMPNKRLKGSFFTQAFFEYLNKYNGQLEPAFSAAKDYTYKKVSMIPPPSDWKGPVPIRQLPRLNPPLPANDPTTIYN